MKARAKLIKNEKGQIQMTAENVKICNSNQDRYETPDLNDALQLHYYGFINIANIEPYININTLYLNNNSISVIENLSHCLHLRTLTLANNQIKEIKNLQNLILLAVLDLSGNKIESVTGLTTLIELRTLNLGANLIEKPEGIKQLVQNHELTSLDLSRNPLLDQQEVYEYLQQMPLLTLYLKQTKFSRGMPNYRKQTICRVKPLTYLDERPVTKDERMLAEAWKQGGLEQEKEARKLIHISKEEKNRKIFNEICERNEIIANLRSELYDQLSKSEQLELTQLKKLRESEEDEKKLRIINRQIEELECYLKYFKEDVQSMGVGEKPQVPKVIYERHEEDAIYLYGVQQSQLEKVKAVYFQNESKQIILRDYKKEEEAKWIPQYEQILEQVLIDYKEVIQMVHPTFNLKVHEFDYEHHRKSRRFTQEEVNEHIEGRSSDQATHSLNELD